MARLGIYLNFMGDTEEAFGFDRSVFGGELAAFPRMGEIPLEPATEPLAEYEQQMVMHIELPILDGTVLMGTDMLESMGRTLRPGNNVTISLEPDTLAETQRLFDALSSGGTDVAPLAPMF